MSPTADSQALTDIQTSVAVIQTEVTALTESVATLNVVLIGNGNVKDSMVVRMSELEQDMGYLNKSRRSFWSRCQWLVTSAIAVTALIVIIVKA